jgi:hypothetical protein
VIEAKQERARRLNAERQARNKAKRVPPGFDERKVCAHPEDWPKIRALERKLREIRATQSKLEQS